MKNEMLSILEGNKTNLSSRQFVGRDLPHPLLLGQEEKQPCFTRDVEDPRQRPSGMTFVFYNDNSMGFTLIELLVVVLIIGILAAVALPQYRRAVDKARFMKLLTPITSIAKAIDAYYLANGTFPTQWDELGITLPGTVDGHYLYQGTAIFSLAYQSVNVLDTTLSGITIYRFSDYRTDEFGGKIACYAETNNSRATKLCKSLSGKTTQDYKASHGAQLIYFIN